MREIELVRPDDGKYPLGEKGFLEWGHMWGWHYNEAGIWTRGQVKLNGQMVGMHDGLDILCPEGTPLVAPCDGLVVIAGTHPNWPTYGNLVQIVLHGVKPYTMVTLAHFLGVDVKEGTFVKEGMTLLGASGNSGNTGGAYHCHIGARDVGPLPIKWKENHNFNVMG